jgi:DNA-binding SARP family transcriptional activator
LLRTLKGDVQSNGEDSDRRRVAIRILGSLQIVDGERVLGPRDLGGTRPKQLLEILLAARGRLVPVDRIAELIWDGQPPGDMRASIQTFVSVLRRRLVDDRSVSRQLVVTEAEAYRFATDAVEFDLDHFDRLLEQSARQPTRAARHSLERALELVRGELLEDEPYALWAQDLRGSYQGRVLGAHLDAADAALAERDFDAALAHADAATLLDRFSERGQRLQMLSLYALGRTHEALARYRDYRKRLDEELGLEPSAETRALEAAVIRQEVVTSLLPRRIARARADADTGVGPFVGRKDELQRLTRAIREGVDETLTLIQIEGATGMGKTRLLDEVQARLDGTRIGRASCSLLERNLPYVPLATALREALADVELGGQLPALQQILPELGVGAPENPAEEIAALEALVALLGEHAPVVLLLDDLHLADRRTLAALVYLRRRAAFAGAIATTSRPASASPAQPPYRLDADVRLQLEPLPYDELAAAGIGELHESTGGDPRLVAEALRCGQGVPPSKTLTDALLAQCRAEGDWGYRVLIAASVLGQPFEPTGLAELLTTDAADLVEELERLCEHRILRIDGLRFRFRNELVRQVLLGSISPARQRLLTQGRDLVTKTLSPSAEHAIGVRAG